MADKKRRTRAPAKRRYKVRVIAQPLPTTPTLTAPVNPIPTLTVATFTASTQTPVTKSAATSIPVTVYNLAKGKFKGIPYPTGRPIVEENPSAPTTVHHNLKLYPMAQHSGSEKTLLGLTHTSLYESVQRQGRLDNSPYTPAVKVEKSEVPPRVAVIPRAMVLPKPQNNRPAEEKCTWEPYCPICKEEEEEGTEQWKSDRKENQKRKPLPPKPPVPQNL